MALKAKITTSSPNKQQQQQQQLVGEKLQDFDILNEIGRGSYGVAMRVKHKDTKLDYVLKKIHLNDASDIQKKEAQREVHLLRKLNHPHIIKFHNSFIENDALYILMEYAEGGNLHKYLIDKNHRNEFVLEYEIWRYAFEICQAVLYLHANNIIHCDIKSENIFLLKNKHIKLGDLGTSRIIRDLGKDEQTKSPLHQQQEVLRKQPFDFKADVWTIGCILYEISCFKYPFELETKNTKDFGSNTKQMNKTTLESLPSFYSENLQQLVFKMLERVPGNRPSLAEIHHMFPEGLWNQFMLEFKNTKNNNNNKNGFGGRSLSLPQQQFQQQQQQFQINQEIQEKTLLIKKLAQFNNNKKKINFPSHFNSLQSSENLINSQCNKFTNTNNELLLQKFPNLEIKYKSSYTSPKHKKKISINIYDLYISQQQQQQQQQYTPQIKSILIRSRYSINNLDNINNNNKLFTHNNYNLSPNKNNNNNNNDGLITNDGLSKYFKKKNVFGFNDIPYNNKKYSLFNTPSPTKLSYSHKINSLSTIDYTNNLYFKDKKKITLQDFQ